MKTILVDAVDAFVVETENGFEIFEPMRELQIFFRYVPVPIFFFLLADML